MFGFNKKSKIVDNKILTKVIDCIQVKLMDLGDITYDIKREPSSTCAYSSYSFIDKIIDYFFGEPAKEHLTVILYSRDDCQKCVWTSVDMDTVLTLTSKNVAFAYRELINPLVRKLRTAYSSLDFKLAAASLSCQEYSK